MAHLRGIVRGQRGGDASRLGTKDSGLVVEAQSWEGKISVHAWHDRATGRDLVEVIQEQHHGAGEHPPLTLYRGPIGRYQPDLDCRQMQERAAGLNALTGLSHT